MMLPEEPVTVPAPAPIVKEDSDVFKTAYMEGCTESGSDWEEYCTCTYNYIDSRLTRKEFIDTSVKYSEDGIEPQIMKDAVSYCL